MGTSFTLTFAGAGSTELRAAKGTGLRNTDASNETFDFREGSPTLGKLLSGAFGVLLLELLRLRADTTDSNDPRTHGSHTQRTCKL